MHIHWKLLTEKGCVHSCVATHGKTISSTQWDITTHNLLRTAIYGASIMQQKNTVLVGWDNARVRRWVSPIHPLLPVFPHCRWHPTCLQFQTGTGPFSLNESSTNTTRFAVVPGTVCACDTCANVCCMTANSTTSINVTHWCPVM